MSRNTKIIIVVVGTLVCSCALLCIAGSIALPQFAERFVSQAQDPTNIRRIASEIADFTLPPGYKEYFGFDVVVTKIVMFAPPNNRGTILMLMQVSAPNADRDQMEQQLRQQFASQTSSSCTDYKRIGEETVTIKGTPSVLSIWECTNTTSRAQMRQEIGVFQGRGGPAMMMAMGPANGWNTATIRRFMESIR